MPRYQHPTTEHVVETSSPTEGVQLRAAGYREFKARTDAVRAADAAKDKTQEKPKGTS